MNVYMKLTNRLACIVLRNFGSRFCETCVFKRWLWQKCVCLYVGMYLILSDKKRYVSVQFHVVLLSVVFITQECQLLQ